ncbi:MAG: flagellar basal body P-ring protein FlgI [Thermodesulfovibrio sp.]|nr:flagellar basal body P-ring protein FlgI [Thermodesulfovibrio sp.]MCX7724496.1 flagellar basal body P-ring protein FlgI [Thermodesulfovibrio sp.]MDW7971690.1 flagellar basal body P-ring protein FlgI [Thermodesulfovibrio sp.]
MRFLFKNILALILLFFLTTNSYAERIKDIANWSGIRENQLVGYGLVVGLNGTGDKDGTYLYQPIANMLSRMGITVNVRDLKGKVKNVAAVMVTAKLPTNVKPGTKIDVQVSSIGDAKSLQGGTLLLTPLLGPDGEVYALAQGPISIGGFIAAGRAAQTVKNHQNVGYIPEGAIVEKSVPVNLNTKSELQLLLQFPDITTAKNIAEKINEVFKSSIAKALDPSTISIIVPSNYRGNVVDFMAEVERIEVYTDVPARVVINERTGTVVIGSNVRISPVALAHGGLTITIKETPEVIQPPTLAPRGATTQSVPRTEIKAEEKQASLVEVKGSTVGELVRALNALGVTPKDLISILQALKTSGALKADLVLM